MYILAWTPNFCGTAFGFEKIEYHDAMTARLTELHAEKYEDLALSLYVYLSDQTDYVREIKKLNEYHNNLHVMEVAIQPEWYGGIDHSDRRIREARIGKILLKYIDRLNDPVEEPDINGFSDTTIDIVKEMSKDFEQEIKWQDELNGQ